MDTGDDGEAEPEINVPYYRAEPYPEDARAMAEAEDAEAEELLAGMAGDGNTYLRSLIGRYRYNGSADGSSASA